MGRQKLLLPIRGRTVIRRLIDTLQAAGVSDIFLLVRQDDERLRNELAATPARVLLARESTADMRHSVALLLEAIERERAPTRKDAWLLTPADHPVLSVTVVQALLTAWNAGRGPILVPTYQCRRGHPTLFGWEFAPRVGDIPPDRGLDWLLERHAAAVDELPVDRPEVLCDLDTPEDYERLQALTDWASDSAGRRPQ
jgi:molybdenum cofactor cytidylyltransferase